MVNLQRRPRVTSMSIYCFELERKDTTLAKCILLQGCVGIATVAEICHRNRGNQNNTCRQVEIYSTRLVSPPNKSLALVFLARTILSVFELLDCSAVHQSRWRQKNMPSSLWRKKTLAPRELRRRKRSAGMERRHHLPAAISHIGNEAGHLVANQYIAPRRSGGGITARTSKTAGETSNTVRKRSRPSSKNLYRRG